MAPGRRRLRRSSERLDAVPRFWDALIHDLKQPLNFLKTVAQDLRIDATRNRLDVETVPATMRAVEEAVDELSGHLSKLHQFANAGANASVEPSDFFEVCQRVAQRAASGAQPAEIGLSLPSELPKVEIRARHLYVALSELVQNAVESESVAGRALAVEISADLHDSELTISVEDVGGGIDDAHVAQIFRPFFTTKAGHGGLGLFLVKSLTEDVGGSIRLAKNAPNGACFELVLPLRA